MERGWWFQLRLRVVTIEARFRGIFEHNYLRLEMLTIVVKAAAEETASFLSLSCLPEV